MVKSKDSQEQNNFLLTEIWSYNNIMQLLTIEY